MQTHLPHSISPNCALARTLRIQVHGTADEMTCFYTVGHLSSEAHLGPRSQSASQLIVL